MSRFRSLLILAPALAFMTALAPPDDKADRKAKKEAEAGQAEAEIKRVLDDANKALLKKDVATLGGIWADDMTMVDPEGQVSTKESLLSEIKSGKLAFESIETGDVKIRVYGKTAVVTGTDKVKAKYEGNEFTGKYRWTDTFVKQKKSWRVVASQLTAYEK